MADILSFPNKGKQYSKSSLQLITEAFEGLRLAAYRDQGGVLTIGYGHTGHDVVAGLVITQAQAETLLAHDIESAANFVIRVVTAVLTQDEFDALVDFVFNVGSGNFLRSTLLSLVNQGKFAQAHDEFEKWDKVAGVENKGLRRRRLSEAELFAHGIIDIKVAA